MNNLKLDIKPSYTSYDHQVRVLVDEIDIFPDLLGLNPIDFFKQDFIHSKASIIIARCECGIIGCFDTKTKIKQDGGNIIWKLTNSNEYIFDENQYSNCINNARNDKLWLTFEKIIERKIGSEFVNYSYLDGYQLGGVSLNKSKNTIKVSYTRQNPKGYLDQKILKFDCKNQDGEKILQAVRNLRDTSGKFTRVK